MKNGLSKEELENDALYETLKALSDCTSSIGLKLYVVGATARDIMMKLLDEYPSRRKTRDLDVAIALSDWSQFDNLSEILQKNHFRKAPANQKFYYEGEDHDNDYEVDIVPFGDIAGENETLVWPPEYELEMSVKCFTDVMDHSIAVSINNSFDVNIATLAGQFFIKLDSYMDRHTKNHKDADDMFFILEKYYVSKVLDSDEIPDDVILEEDNEIIRGAQWLASEIKHILSDEHLADYSDMIKTELDKKTESDLIKDFIKLYGDEKDDAYDVSLSIWTNIYDILNKEIEERNEDK